MQNAGLRLLTRIEYIRNNIPMITSMLTNPRLSTENQGYRKTDRSPKTRTTAGFRTLRYTAGNRANHTGSDEVRGSIPLGSIQKGTPSHYVMAFLFVWIAKGANPGAQPARRKWLGCFEETASNVRARRLNLPLKVLVEFASSAYNQESDMPLGTATLKMMEPLRSNVLVVSYSRQ